MKKKAQELSAHQNASNRSPCGGLLSHNGSIVHKIRVKAGKFKGRTLTFTQHSPDHYTVYGLSPLEYAGVSIERRKHQDFVLRESDSAQCILRPQDEWIAYCVRARCYYGAFAIGATAQEAYENMFKDRFFAG